ncbi:unnamed protein product, partial [Laminaria digitata]
PTLISRPLSAVGFGSHRLPSRRKASCSRPDRFPSRRKGSSRLFPSHRLPSCSHPIRTFARIFSHPATHLWSRCSHPIYHRFFRFPITQPWMQLDYATLDLLKVVRT